MQRAKEMSPDQSILLNCCGRGDKDMNTIAHAMGVNVDSGADTE